VRTALDTMRQRKVRRLPVVDASGRLAGIISIHDLAIHARTGKGAEVPADAVLDTFVAITAPTDLPVHA
jgi:CBS domain-containing protein